jgi:hypothetical protein
MPELNPFLRFVLTALATWRLTHLLALEDGPGDLVVKLRKRLGTSVVGRMMDCFHCLSLWVAAPLSVLVVRDPWDLLLVWLALSGAACLLQGLQHEPVVIHHVPGDAKGEDDGLLRRQ